MSGGVGRGFKYAPGRAARLEGKKARLSGATPTRQRWYYSFSLRFSDADEVLVERMLAACASKGIGVSTFVRQAIRAMLGEDTVI